MNIGILGSGNVGGTLGTRWAERGHQVVFSSRNPNFEEMKPLLRPRLREESTKAAQEIAGNLF
jgi:8-hydroxy-5-deazaflavin:NADPH oxidoreductase